MTGFAAGRWSGRISAGISAALALAALTMPLAGCAGIFYGRDEVVVVDSERAGGTVRLNDGRARPLPATLRVERVRTDNVLTLTLPADSVAVVDTNTVSMVELDRRLNGAVWLNLVLGWAAPLGAWADWKYGGAWKQELSRAGALPPGVRVAVDPDPETRATARGKAGVSYSAMSDPLGTLVSDRIGLDVGLMVVHGGSDWPVLAEARTGTGVTALSADGFFLFEGGVRRELGGGAVRPFLAGGPGFVTLRIRDDGQVAFGYWSRAGLDLRIDHRFYVEPFLGYGSYGRDALRPALDRLNAGVSIGFLYAR